MSKPSTANPAHLKQRLLAVLPGLLRHADWSLAALALSTAAWLLCGAELKQLNSKNLGIQYSLQDAGQEDGFIGAEVQRTVRGETRINNAPFAVIAPPNAMGLVTYSVKHKPGWNSALLLDWPKMVKDNLIGKIEFNGREITLGVQNNVLQIYKDVPGVRDYRIHLAWQNPTPQPLPFVTNVQFVWVRSVPQSIPTLLGAAIIGCGLLFFGGARQLLPIDPAAARSARLYWGRAALALIIAIGLSLGLVFLRPYPIVLIAFPAALGALCWRVADLWPQWAGLRRLALPAFFVLILLAAVHTRTEFLGREFPKGLQADAIGYLQHAQRLLKKLDEIGWLAWVVQGEGFKVFPREPMIVWLMMCGLSILPQADPVQAAMLSTCFVSLLCIPLFFLVCLRYFGALAAIAGTFVFGLNPFLCSFAFQGLRLELYMLGILLQFVLLERISLETASGKPAGAFSWRAFYRGQPRCAAWALIAGIVLGYTCLVRVSTLFTLAMILAPYCIFRRIKIRDAGIILLTGLLIALPNLYVSWSTSKHHDPFYSANVAAIFYHNYEFYGAPGEITLHEFSANSVQGRPRTMFEYIFKEHSLTEVCKRSLLGFFWIYFERDAQRYFYGWSIYQLQRLPELNGLAYLESLSWFWLAAYWIGALVIVRRHPRFSFFCLMYMAPLFFLRGHTLYFFDPRLYYHMAIFWSAAAGVGLQYIAENLGRLHDPPGPAPAPPAHN